jgi:initiation factor 1A
MGKKLVGGGYRKNQAKSNSAPQASHAKLRVKEEEGEIYAIVVKMLGGGMAHVECIDGMKRLCHFRGKFSGKNKRQNEISSNTWVMVGTREWESDKSLVTSGKKKDQLNNCDMLEVYNDHQKSQLITMQKEPWHMLAKHDTTAVAEKSGEHVQDTITFQSDSSAEYNKLMSEFAGSGSIGAIGTSAEDSLAQLRIDVADI